MSNEKSVQVSASVNVLSTPFAAAGDKVVQLTWLLAFRAGIVAALKKLFAIADGKAPIEPEVRAAFPEGVNVMPLMMFVREKTITKAKADVMSYYAQNVGSIMNVRHPKSGMSVETARHCLRACEGIVNAGLEKLAYVFPNGPRVDALTSAIKNALTEHKAAGITPLGDVPCVTVDSDDTAFGLADTWIAQNTGAAVERRIRRGKAIAACNVVRSDYRLARLEVPFTHVVGDGETRLELPMVPPEDVSEENLSEFEAGVGCAADMLPSYKAAAEQEREQALESARQAYGDTLRNGDTRLELIETVLGRTLELLGDEKNDGMHVVHSVVNLELPSMDAALAVSMTYPDGDKQRGDTRRHLFHLYGGKAMRRGDVRWTVTKLHEQCGYLRKQAEKRGTIDGAHNLVRLEAMRSKVLVCNAEWLNAGAHPLLAIDVDTEVFAIDPSDTRAVQEYAKTLEEREDFRDRIVSVIFHATKRNAFHLVEQLGYVVKDEDGTERLADVAGIIERLPEIERELGLKTPGTEIVIANPQVNDPRRPATQEDVNRARVQKLNERLRPGEDPALPGNGWAITGKNGTEFSIRPPSGDVFTFHGPKVEKPSRGETRRQKRVEDRKSSSKEGERGGKPKGSTQLSKEERAALRHGDISALEPTAAEIQAVEPSEVSPTSPDAPLN